MAVALALVSGVLVVPAAIGATLLIIYVLSGIGQIQLDGHFIALQLLMIAAFHVVSDIGFEHLAYRIFKSVVGVVRGRRVAAATAK